MLCGCAARSLFFPNRRVFDEASYNSPALSDGSSNLVEPRLRGDVLPWHLFATFLQASFIGANSILPVIAITQFHAGEWQSAILAGAGPTLAMVSIFWGELLRRVSIQRYLIVFWAVTFIPFAAVGFSTALYQLFAGYLLCVIGWAAWSPVEGRLLKAFYADDVRGRRMGALGIARVGGGALSALGIGWIIHLDRSAIAACFLSVALLQLLGVLILGSLARGRIPQATAIAPTRLLAPIIHMREVLAADRNFYHYERAFMTYGIGWMICTAVLPTFATHQLGMTLVEYAGATQVTFLMSSLLANYPVGMVNDRLGPIRTSGLAFGLLVLYPIGLYLCHSVSQVTLVTILYGATMTGVNMGWSLGPILLAGSSEKTTQYVAIHASLVGVRAVIGQIVGMGLLQLTGRYESSFVVAVIVFGLASRQMWRLHREMAGAPARV